MLANYYKDVSANKCIVFTCFLITFICLLVIPAVAQSDFHNPINSNAQSTIQNNSVTNTTDDPHRNLENQLYSFINNKMILANGNNGTTNDIRVQVREIDKRINIPFCDSPFEFDTGSSNVQQSNMSVKVMCIETNWYLFMHANVAVIQKVVVTSDNLSPGTLLSSRNLKVIEIDKNKLRGSTFSSIEEVTGARIKRRTRSGNVIDDRMLCFICKGDRVTIAAVSSGLSIKVYGVAEEDGVLGDTIQVRNLSSDKLVFAKIASTSQVEIRI
jgi:flagella basal body P-ring formation protein FlgA